LQVDAEASEESAAAVEKQRTIKADEPGKASGPPWEAGDCETPQLPTYIILRPAPLSTDQLFPIIIINHPPTTISIADQILFFGFLEEYLSVLHQHHQLLL
jgi:hypothetical protein